MELNPQIKSKTAGVALLMTLSVLLLLSIALAKTFENRAVEIAHLGSNIQRFQAETLSRSLFRATLKAIHDKGLFMVFYGLKQLPAGLPIPFEDGTFSDLEIKSIDSLYNINRRYTAAKPDRVTILFNIVYQLKVKKQDPNAGGYIALSVTDIQSLASVINDWTDPNAVPDVEFLDGIEYYTDTYPPFEMKNAAFDRLSEIKLIPRFQELELTQPEIVENFRALGGAEEFIDINLSGSEEVKQFLERFGSTDDGAISDYRNVYDHREEIAQLVEEGKTGLPEPKYKLSIPPYGRSSLWQKELDENLGIYGQMTQAEKDLFRNKTDTIAIRFTFRIGKTVLKTDSVVRIKYSGAKITSFVILSLKMQ